MELNNIKHNDLDRWKDIQRDLFKIYDPSEHIVIQHFKTDSINRFSVNNKLLEPQKAKNIQERNLILRTFTLIASLTDRISHRDLWEEDKYLYKTLMEIKKYLKDSMENVVISEAFAMAGMFKGVKSIATAGRMNQSIVKKMEQYIKHL